MKGVSHNARYRVRSTVWVRGRLMPWMIVLAAYFAVGFTLIFVGPAARARRREQIKWEWHPARRLWIQKILTLLN